MSGPVDLGAEREAREPHTSGPWVCLECRHRWVAVAPTGVLDGCECPKCGTYKGVMAGLIWPAKEDRAALWTCRCGSDLFCIVKRPGLVSVVKCIRCAQEAVGWF